MLIVRRLDELEVNDLEAFFLAGGSHTFQKRRVSSAAAEQMVVPSGDTAVWRTLEVWPWSSATLVMEG